MGWLEGLLTGYVDRSHEIEKEKMDAAVAANQREGQIFQALLNSPDRQIREYAGAGMLDMANPLRKAKGLRGWMGEVERSPMLGVIRKYMQTPQSYEVETTPAGLPSTQHTGYQLPPGQASRPPVAGALPAESPTEAGAPPITAPVPTPPTPGRIDPEALATMPPPPPPPQAPPGAAVAPPPPEPPQSAVDTEQLAAGPPPVPYDAQLGTYTAPQPYRAEAVGQPPPAPPAAPAPAGPMSTTREVPGTPAVTETRTRYPQAFPTAVDMAASATFGRDSGEFDAAVEMFRRAGAPNPEQAATEYITSQKTGGGYAAGPVIPDPSSPTGYSQQWVDRHNPAIRQSVPAPAPGSTSNRAANISEQVAHTLYGQPGEDAKTTFARIQREPGGPVKMMNVMKRAQFFVASKPLDVAQKFQAQGRLQDDWMQIAKGHQVLVPQIQIMRQAWARAHQDPANIPAASEQILITFQRMLDPDSVVRETEARRPGSMQAILTRIQGWVDANVVGGPGIPLEQMAPYYEAAEDILRMSEARMAQERQRILATGEQYELGPLNLVGFQPAPPRPGGPPPPPGAGATGAGTTGAATGAAGGGGIGLTTPLDQIDPVTGQRIRP